MKTVVTLAAAVAGIFVAGPASASPCMDRISALEARLDEKAETAISTSSGGQGLAGARERQAMQAENKDVPVGEPAAPFQNEKREAQVTARAADAGGGGDRIMQAKANLNRARALDREGKVDACQDVVAEAEGQLDPD
jgi:hypothetical protein